MLKYYSQDGQDKFLDQQVFKGKTNGVFIDVGANDGVTFSNTYFLELNRGWTGICIEPHPSAFNKLLKNRKTHLVNAGISRHEGEMEFLQIEGYGEMLSGLTTKYDTRHRERIERDLKVHGGTIQNVKVNCVRLDALMTQYSLSQVDYCSIDTEGGELEIVESADLKNNHISYFSIENNFKDQTARKLMRGYGYTLIAKIGADEFYRRRRKAFWWF